MFPVIAINGQALQLTNGPLFKKKRHALISPYGRRGRGAGLYSSKSKNSRNTCFIFCKHYPTPLHMLEAASTNQPSVQECLRVDEPNTAALSTEKSYSCILNSNLN